MAQRQAAPAPGPHPSTGRPCRGPSRARRSIAPHDVRTAPEPPSWLSFHACRRASAPGPGPGSADAPRCRTAAVARSSPPEPAAPPVQPARGLPGAVQRHAAGREAGDARPRRGGPDGVRQSERRPQPAAADRPAGLSQHASAAIGSTGTPLHTTPHRTRANGPGAAGPIPLRPIWRRGGVATQRPAKPSTPVRFRSSP